MTSQPRDLAALISSRICHDLISPIGAISNGLELLSMTGLPRSPELQLIEDSCNSAAGRIGFFRIAFGDSGTGQTVTATEIRQLLLQMSNGGRLSYRWTGSQDVPRAAARLGFLAAMCVELAMPRGGLLEIKDHGDGCTVTGTCDDGLDVDRLRLALQTLADTSIPPSQVQAAVLVTLTTEAGLDLYIDETPGRVVLQVG